MIALDVEENTPTPVWLRRQHSYRGQRAEWKRGIFWKAVFTGIIVVVSIISLPLIMSPSSRSSIFPGWHDKLPTSSNPNITYLQPQYFKNLHSERVKIKYGPFTVTGNEIADFSLQNATKPCSDCMITFMQANLEYEDGSVANADTGMWLHHTVLLSPSQPDTVCPRSPERVFASGNERTPVDLCAEGTKEVGYHLTSSASLLLTTELMNETPHPSAVHLILTYEYIPSPPPSFLNVKPIWLDIAGICSNSEYDIPEDREVFEARSEAWISEAEGEIVVAAGHLHDSGVDLRVLRDEEEVCESTAIYGGKEGYVEKGGMEHISDMSVCTEMGRMAKGEEWRVVARYDLGEHEAMVGVDGELEPVMGIALLYVAEDRKDEVR